MPGEAQPRQISPKGFGQFSPTARTVDILNPQQEFPPISTRAIMRHNGGIGMSKMQRSVGTGGETSADHACRSNLPSLQRKLWTGALFPA